VTPWDLILASISDSTIAIANLFKRTCARSLFWALQFLSAIRSAEAVGCAPALLRDAIELSSALSGEPGEYSLEVYWDMEKNLAQTEAFIAR
jgi:hypothetical protein